MRSRDKRDNREYTRLMNSARWRKLRRAYLLEHPLCEECQAKGLYVAAQCVHHKQPIEDAHNPDEMALLAYNWTNLQALCFECHKAIHQAADYHKATQVLQRKEDAADAYLSSMGIEAEGKEVDEFAEFIEHRQRRRRSKH